MLRKVVICLAGIALLIGGFSYYEYTLVVTNTYNVSDIKYIITSLKGIITLIETKDPTFLAGMGEINDPDVLEKMCLGIMLTKYFPGHDPKLFMFSSVNQEDLMSLANIINYVKNIVIPEDPEIIEVKGE